MAVCPDQSFHAPGTSGRSALDHAAIVRAAFDLLEDVGIDGLSTRRLAQALGVKGPSLYWHIRSMRELFDHMAEAMMARALPAPNDHPDDWRVWLATGARGIRREALACRDGARILAGARPTGASPTLSFAAMMGRLTREGFSAAQARAALTTLGRYAVGWVLHEQMARGPSAPLEADFEFGLQAMVAGLALQHPSASPATAPD